jgi:putative nucleotidyltransferase with HDIG domain
MLGLEPEEAGRWIAQQHVWKPELLVHMGQLAGERLAAEWRLKGLDREVRDLSLNLSATYEEISLIYRLTQNLKLTSKDEELAQLALEWLADVLPAESLAIQLRPTDRTATPGGRERAQSLFLSHGPCPITGDDLAAIIEHLQLVPGERPLIVNRAPTATDPWPWPQVRQLIVVSLVEAANSFGWLVAINRADGLEFGSVEASLLNSVAAILGIHSGNAELYQQQREFFAGVVRALTSAIDAKDPYTCGHSDRVARVAVRLAEELGCDRKQIDTIYLSGLLHDVGKIGIDDHVLRKPGKLTEAEFEHIKTHTEIGHKILSDIKQLDEVLPVVLHHHEQWDGRGYPRGLAAEEIPYLARIVAVADAFDAMGSDRPYREGMADEKLDSILHAGAGQQWDANVVDAYFRARDDIRAIARQQVKNVSLDRQWT